jgi:hypothetical protein
MDERELRQLEEARDRAIKAAKGLYNSATAAGPIPVSTMTELQDKHLDWITDAIRNRIEVKYRQGQHEHGGNLWDIPVIGLVDNAIDEALDQLTYLITIKQLLLSGVPTREERK